MDYENVFIGTNLDFEPIPYFFSLRGVSFENRQKIIPNLKCGQKVYLKRDYNNEYDKKAIMTLINYNDEFIQIGWIPKEISSALAFEIDAGIKWYGKIFKITGGNDKTYGIVIEIFNN